MTYEEQICYILENKKFPIPIVYGILRITGLLIFSVLSLTAGFGFIFKAFTTHLFSTNESAWVLFVFVVIALYYGFAVLFGLKDEWVADRCFKEIMTNLPVNDNLYLLTNILRKNFRVKEEVVNERNNVVSIITKMSLLTWGTKITVVCDENRILVNSKSARKSQLFSYGQNRRNVKKIVLQTLKKCS